MEDNEYKKEFEEYLTDEEINILVERYNRVINYLSEHYEGDVIMIGENLECHGCIDILDRTNSKTTAMNGISFKTRKFDKNGKRFQGKAFEERRKEKQQELKDLKIDEFVKELGMFVYGHSYIEINSINGKKLAFDPALCYNLMFVYNSYNNSLDFFRQSGRIAKLLESLNT